jgi:RimJ/RimL family protein N-acetyltransferase
MGATLRYTVAMGAGAEPIRLETERLIVRRYEECDIPDILAYSRCEPSDRFRRRNVDWELNAESVHRWWTPMIAMRPEEAINWLSLVVELKSEAQVIGNVGFNAKRIGDHLQGSIGWTLGVEHEGHGYATEAAQALLDYLFGSIGFHRVFAMSSPSNANSWRLMERLGMQREAHFRRNCFLDGAWDDEYVYAILQEEWAERRNRRPA